MMPAPIDRSAVDTTGEELVPQCRAALRRRIDRSGPTSGRRVARVAASFVVVTAQRSSRAGHADWHATQRRRRGALRWQQVRGTIDVSRTWRRRTADGPSPIPPPPGRCRAQRAAPGHRVRRVPVRGQAAQRGPAGRAVRRQPRDGAGGGPRAHRGGFPNCFAVLLPPSSWASCASLPPRPSSVPFLKMKGRTALRWPFAISRRRAPSFM